jgi:hypothetical protein
MPDIRSLLRETYDAIVPPDDVLSAVVRRRVRRDRRRKAIAVIVAIAVIGGGFTVVVREMRRPSSGPPPDDQIPVILDGGRLAAGPHVLSLQGLRIIFDVPDGWRGTTLGVIDSDLGSGPPSGSGLSFWVVTNVYEDPCRWNSSLADPPVGPGVSDLVAALATQKRHFSGDRLKLDVAGYLATELRMQVPENLAMGTCWNDEFHTWQSLEGDRLQQGPGQIDQLFVVNVLESRLVIDASFFPGTSDDDRQTLFDMVRSVHFV